MNTVGIIETKHGKGSYIASNPLSKAFKNIFPPIVLSTDLESIKLLEARRFIEVGTTRLAANNIDARQLERLESYIESMEKATGNDDLEKFQKSDLKFHLGIAEGCDNEFLFGLLQGLRNLMEEQLSFVLNIPGRIESSLNYHKQILNGLQEGNPEKASEAVAEHIRNATQDIRESEKNELLSF